MFNRKLKQQIKALEANNKCLETKVVELEKRLAQTAKDVKWIEWRCNNKPKFNVGDTMGNFTIKQRFFAPPVDLSVVIFHHVAALFLAQRINHKLNHIDANSIIENFNNKFSQPTWKYYCTNNTTDTTVTKTEKELEDLLNVKSA